MAAREPIHINASQIADHPILEPQRDRPMSISGPFSVAAIGDVVMSRPFAHMEDGRVQEALAPLRAVDLVIGNLEQTIADPRTFRGHHYGVFAFLIMAHPKVAQDLAAMGFDILSRANNRLSDFGNEGNRETDRHLRAAGITPVGFGEHLAAARAPVYHDLSHGRVSAIGVTTHVNHGVDQVFAPSARVGLSEGRPGANNIRYSRTITLPHQAWCDLRDFALRHDFAFPGPFVIMPTVEIYEDRFRIGHDWYHAGEKAGYEYRGHTEDVADVMRHIRNAAYNSNFTIFSIHTHQWMIDGDDPKGGIAGEVPRPGKFIEDLAKQAIDNGADIFCVHGPFDFRGIEIYRGKPIFYGLGSFTRQAYMQELVTWETYRASQFGLESFESVNPLTTDRTDAELLFERTAKHPSRYFEGAIPTCHNTDGKIERIDLLAIDLGYEGPASDLGIPRKAGEEKALKIFERITSNCAPYGTGIDVKGSHAAVTFDASA